MAKEYEWQTILGQIPSKSNQYRVITLHGHGSLAKTKALKEYESSFYMQVGAYRNLMIEGYFELYVRVYFTSMSHDLDNSLKCLLDCLQYTKTIKNDNRCVKIVAEKFLDKEKPRIEFKLVEI
ncbi:MAG: RusA family crossover junction endodeoxyribonuclease [Bacteroidales bacterium]|nr:RusA family crossover junction endodeoxyribonuclease [Bacteroidales bacterium]